MKLRLSEAIRLGSMLRPQGFGDFIANGGACAFGAAYEACGLLHVMVPNIKVPFPALAEFPWICPQCGAHEDAPEFVISEHLNDKHRWSREKIADWCESVEREIEAKQQPADSLVDLTLQEK